MAVGGGRRCALRRRCAWPCNNSPAHSTRAEEEVTLDVWCSNYQKACKYVAASMAYAALMRG